MLENINSLIGYIIKIGKYKDFYFTEWAANTRIITMNEHTLKGEWNQMKGSVKQKWGELTNDDLDQIEGSRDKLVGRVQERYGHSKEDAERDVDNWRRENNY